ncbi:TfoX/Sxy family DNA transformation protein [uncultured Oscillibacter sp.]|mgnify:CR=1 FL=1|uniref:TfoX/Sxy family DNA transformation protein n=1 Tax=uncultured Oscillibacter sp. TaxID=876091 RepID=UPI0025E67494|nr:TfoX/Sxy family DNA transformation protein [uncultured Oscillibacter sp.]
MTELTSMANIGAEMARKLRSAGIHSAEELMATGSKQAFFQLKTLYPQVCLVHLYALEGAIQHVEFNSLSEDQKRDLKAFSDCLKGRRPPPPETANPSEDEDRP